MGYSFSCECGNEIEVKPAQAGTELACGCGRTLTVPRLSQLRQFAGEEAYETGVIDTIHRLIRSGELPSAENCVISGIRTAHTCELYVQCESSWMKGGEDGSGPKVVTFLALLAPIFLIRLLLYSLVWSKEEPTQMGRDRGIYVPLRVHEQFAEELRQIRSQAKLRELLSSEPIYATLLEEYPRAKILIV